MKPFMAGVVFGFLLAYMFSEDFGMFIRAISPVSSVPSDTTGMDIREIQQ